MLVCLVGPLGAVAFCINDLKDIEQMMTQSLECTREAYFSFEDEEFYFHQNHIATAHVDIFLYSVLHSLRAFCHKFLSLHMEREGGREGGRKLG